MSVTAQTPVNSYTANGVTTVFNFSFLLLAAADLDVYIDGVLKTITADYSVSGLEINSGGTVTFLSAPADGAAVVLQRNSDIARTTDYQENGDLRAQTLDLDFDRLWLVLQELIYKYQLAPSLLPGSPLAGSITLPDPIAGLYLRWNALANNLENGDPAFYSGTILPPSSIISTFTDLAITPAATPGMVVYIKQHTSNGLGGGFFMDKSGTITNDGGTKINNTATTGRHWERIGYFNLTPEMFGLLSDGSDERAKIDLFNAANKLMKVDGNVTATGTIRALHDLNFVGNGSINGIYRKNVIPEITGSDDLTLCDISPAKHLRHACSVAKPVVVLIGDSISTYSANTNSRGDMLVETIREKLNHDFPSGVTFYNRSIGGQRYGTLFTNQSSAGIPWYTVNVVNWLTDVVTNLAPDLVIFSFGMNDSSIADITAMKAAIDYLEGLSKKPSIIHCTNLVPRTDTVNVGAGDEKSTMDSRDYAAGLYRTYAKFRGIGLIDIHRKYCKALDGFDPASTALKQGGSLTFDIFGAPNNRRYTSSSTATERQWSFYFDDSAAAAWMNSGVGIVVDFTGGTLQLTRSAGNLGISYAAGGQTLISTFVACSFTNTLQWNLTIEMKNGWLNIYSAWDPVTGYGGYVEPIYSGRIAYPGGESVNRAYSPGLMNANFREGIYIKNRPSIKNSDFWGIEGANVGYEGSGFNHPSHWAATAVYRDMIQSLNFYAYVPRTGQIAVASGMGSIQVSLTPNELSANYRVFVEFSDIGGAVLPVVTGRVEFRTGAKFDYFFTANTNYAMTMHWTLIRF